MFKGLSACCVYICLVACHTLRRIQIEYTARWHRLKVDNSCTQKTNRLYQKAVHENTSRGTGWPLGIAVDKMRASLAIAIGDILSHFSTLAKKARPRCEYKCFHVFSFSPVSHVQAGSRWYRDAGAVRSGGQILHRVPPSAERCSDHPGELPQPDHFGHHPSPSKIKGVF